MDGQPSPATRWAAIALAVASTVLVAMIVAYVVAYGSPTGTGPGGAVTVQDQAAHVLARWPLVSRLWLVEALAWVVVAVSSLALQRRERPASRWLPANVAWVMVGVGALVQSLMYAFMVGGYPASAGAAAETPALFLAFRGAAMFLFGVSNLVISVGHAGVLLAEAAPDGVLPRWLALGGGALSLVLAVLFGGVLIGAVDMMVAAPLALVVTLVVAWLGVAIARRG